VIKILSAVIAEPLIQLWNPSLDIISFLTPVYTSVIQEEQKVIEAKIRMRQQELQDDEEREQRRNNDVRDNHPPPHPAILPPDSDRDDWQAACETISHPSQVSLHSDYTEPDSHVSHLWPFQSKPFKPKVGAQIGTLPSIPT